MNKIMPEHLARSRASADNMAWSIELGSSAGTTFKLSMTTLANPAVGQRGRDLRSCWQPYVRAESGQLCRLRPPAWHGTAVTGTRYWSSAAW